MRLRSVLSVSAVLSLFCVGAFASFVHAEAGEEAAKVNGEESAKSKPDDNITYLAVSAELATVARAIERSHPDAGCGTS